MMGLAAWWGYGLLQAEPGETLAEHVPLPSEKSERGEKRATGWRGEHAYADAKTVVQAKDRDEHAASNSSRECEREGPDRSVGLTPHAQRDPRQQRQQAPGEEEER